MNKNNFYFLATLALALSSPAAFGAHTSHSGGTASTSTSTGTTTTTSTTTGTSVAKLPTGIQQITITQATSTWFSMPLSEQPVFTGMVSGVSANSISITSTASNFTSSYASAGAPYFVQFLTGQEAGRTLLITGNTITSLTLDTTDHGIGSTVALNASNFSVAAGDTFDIFPGDTLASVFGANTSSNPLVLTGSANQGNADQVSLWTTSDTVYYFNTAAGHWETTGSSANANNTVIYPYSAVSVYRQAGSNATLVLTGQVTPANACQKIILNTNVYGSSHYPTAITLSQLQMGFNWQTGSNGNSADDLAVWSAAANGFTFYYQKPNGNWYLCTGNSTATQNSVVIPAGGVTVIYKRADTTNANVFLVSALPYSVSAN